MNVNNVHINRTFCCAVAATKRYCVNGLNIDPRANSDNSAFCIIVDNVKIIKLIK